MTDFFTKLREILGLTKDEGEINVFPQFAEELGLVNATGTINIVNVDKNFGWFEIDFHVPVPNTKAVVHLKGRVTVEVTQ